MKILETKKFTIYNATFENPNHIDLTRQIRKKNSQLIVPKTELNTQAKELKDCPVCLGMVHRCRDLSMAWYNNTKDFQKMEKLTSQQFVNYH